MHIVHTILAWVGYTLASLGCALWLYGAAFVIGLTH
jgi:hypothetical protein